MTQRCLINLARAGVALVYLCVLGTSLNATANTDTITVADASLSAAFYSDSSCLLTIDSLAQSGKTVIDADVDNVGSRMLIHCDTDSGRRLTLLARGDSLNVSQRVPLLTREQIQEDDFGMIVWLTRSGVQYADDSAPRRYVIAGSVMLRKSPPVDVAGTALHSQQQSFATVTGVLEPIVKTNNQTITDVPVDPESANKDAPVNGEESDAVTPATVDANDEKSSTNQSE